jgi:hypothetical protein
VNGIFVVVHGIADRRCPAWPASACARPSRTGRVLLEVHLFDITKTVRQADTWNS